MLGSKVLKPCNHYEIHMKSEITNAIVPLLVKEF